MRSYNFTKCEVERYDPKLIDIIDGVVAEVLEEARPRIIKLIAERLNIAPILTEELKIPKEGWTSYKTREEAELLD